MSSFFIKLKNLDWVLLSSVAALLAAGLVTMRSFVGETLFFERQVAWAAFGLLVFFVASLIDWRFLRRSGVVTWLFILSALALLFLFVVGTTTLGATSRFNLGIFFVQPSDIIKLVLIIVLAKYFSRRHIEIAHIRHILISGFYALVLFVLVLFQPDFGSAIILFLIWLGMVLVSGISKKHLLAVFLAGTLAFGLLWGFAFQEYQKQRILTFLNPLTDLQGAGYNAYQSTVAVGSGELIGKGVGFGTQSRLQFLPEYETDFIFAAFAEEWGFIGTLLLLAVFGVILWRVLVASVRGATNFETLFGLGFAILIASHVFVHAGINIGLLPVTGTTLPFVSYGGSHLLMEFLGLGMLAGMRRYRRPTHPEAYTREVPGIDHAVE